MTKSNIRFILPATVFSLLAAAVSAGPTYTTSFEVAEGGTLPGRRVQFSSLGWTAAQGSGAFLFRNDATLATGAGIGPAFRGPAFADERAFLGPFGSFDPSPFVNASEGTQYIGWRGTQGRPYVMDEDEFPFTATGVNSSIRTLNFGQRDDNWTFSWTYRHLYRTDGVSSSAFQTRFDVYGFASSTDPVMSLRFIPAVNDPTSTYSSPGGTDADGDAITTSGRLQILHAYDATRPNDALFVNLVDGNNNAVDIADLNWQQLRIEADYAAGTYRIFYNNQQLYMQDFGTAGFDIQDVTDRVDSGDAATNYPNTLSGFSLFGNFTMRGILGTSNDQANARTLNAVGVLLEAGDGTEGKPYNNDYALWDDIRVVPEPSSILLLGLAAGALIRRRRHAPMA